MTTYYIATTGNDTTGVGSVGNPWLTLAKFLSSSASGDTCIVAAGTYTWATATITSRTIRGPSSDNPAIFDGAGAAVRWALLGAVVLQNLKFQNMNHAAALDAAFAIATAASISVEKCIFTNIAVSSDTVNGRGGLFSTNSLEAVTFTIFFSGCAFNDITSSASGGYIIGASRNSGAQTQSYIFENCIFLAITATNALDYFTRTESSGSDSAITVEITNCIFYNNTGTTITLYAFVFGGAKDTITYAYSCAYNMTTVPSGTGNITSDPLFVDAAAGNFELRQDSPCINAGTLA